MARKRRKEAPSKSEIIKQVHRHVQKAQYKKAVQALDGLIEANPADVRLQHKKADLLLRGGKKRQAMSLYSKVAAGYAHQCFHLKAIAVLKQILKCDGHRPDIHQRLADQYEQVGLKREAICSLGEVANHYERKGKHSAVQQTLRRIFQLGQDRIQDPVRLGDLYARSGLLDEAAAFYRHAAGVLKKKGEIQAYIEVLERLAAHDRLTPEMDYELAVLQSRSGGFGSSSDEQSLDDLDIPIEVSLTAEVQSIA